MTTKIDFWVDDWIGQIWMLLPLCLSILKLRNKRQGRRKIDNWGGGGLIFIYSCSASLISFEIDDCSVTVCEHKYMNISPPPQLSIFRHPLTKSDVYTITLKVVVAREYISALPGGGAI